MIRLARALAAAAILAGPVGCGGSKHTEPIAVGSTIPAVPKPVRRAARYAIDGTVVAVSGRRMRVDVEDAGGAGERRIATAAPLARRGRPLGSERTTANQRAKRAT